MHEGHPPTDAYREAVRRFGPLHESRARLVDAARHREIRMQRSELLADLRQDLSFAARTLARGKVWTSVTISTLALGIGATTAVFSVVSNLLLHSVPYPSAGSRRHHRPAAARGQQYRHVDLGQRLRPARSRVHRTGQVVRAHRRLYRERNAASRCGRRRERYHHGRGRADLPLFRRAYAAHRTHVHRRRGAIERAPRSARRVDLASALRRRPARAWPRDLD